MKLGRLFRKESWKSAWRRVKWRRLAGRLVTSFMIALALAWLALEVALRLVPFDPSIYSDGEISTIIFARDGTPLRAYLANDDRWRVPVRLDEISPWLIKATVAIEDRRFYSHSGVDLRAVGRAVVQNFRSGRIVSGASTLTMQVAGFQQGRQRTLGRKLVQAFRALQIERHLTKDQILELYLTHAPYGGNICGAEAAARRYFNKGARDLTLNEASLLAGIPQSPTRLRPDRNLPATLERRGRVLDAMLETGVIQLSDRERIAKRAPTVGSFDTVMKAPHFSDLVQSRYASGARVQTTLDLGVQSKAEQVLKDQVNQLRRHGVTNGAVVVIDNASGAVLALVGSADYGSIQDEGQINGAVMARSPGSTLKPLLYAWAYQCGNLLPQTVLYDVPQQFPEYQPENFDRTFRGLVSSDEALAWSLNIPAIQVLNETGLDRSLQFLQSCGMRSLRQPPGSYGLSLAVGTCRVSLLELTNAYAMLARGGEFRPFQLIREKKSGGPKPGGAGVPLLSPAACYFVNRALADVYLRPPESIDPVLAGMDGVAWKTGTSSGFKDAWTVAYDRKYTVGVWIGNFNGRASRALVGAQAAAPVALRMIQLLRGSTHRGTWPDRPTRGLRELTVCSVTGAPATENCPTTATAEALDPRTAALPGRLMIPRPAQCAVHRRARIDNQTGHELCTRCYGSRAWTEKIFAYWPTPVASWLLAAHQNTNLPAAHNPDCPTVAKGAGIRITSPMNGDSFLLMPGRPPEAQKLALEAAAPSGAGTLYWFLNGELQETTAQGTTSYLTPSAGTHHLRCMDDRGHADAISFTVTE